MASIDRMTSLLSTLSDDEEDAPPKPTRSDSVFCFSNWLDACCQPVCQKEELRVEVHEFREDEDEEEEDSSADEAGGEELLRGKSSDLLSIASAEEFRPGRIQKNLDRSPSTTAPNSPEATPSDSHMSVTPARAGSLASSLPSKGGSMSSFGGFPGDSPDWQGLRDPVLKAALRAGRLKNVERRLQELQKQGKGGAERHLPKPLLERLRRSSACYETSLKLWYNSMDNLSWRNEKVANGTTDLLYRLSDDHLQVITSKDCHNIDALRAFVGLQEMDLARNVFNEAYHAEELNRDSSGESLWRFEKRGLVGAEDFVAHVSAVDGLSEPLGSLWVMAFTPGMYPVAPPFPPVRQGSSSAGIVRPSMVPKQTPPEVAGVKLPNTKDGTVRIDYWEAICIITPIWGRSKGLHASPPSCRITLELCRRVESATAVFPLFVRKEAEKLMDTLTKYLENQVDIAWRTVASKAAPLYNQVRRHLEEKKPAGLKACRPLPKMPAAELTKNLPKNWADVIEPINREDISSAPTTNQLIRAATKNLDVFWMEPTIL